MKIAHRLIAAFAVALMLATGAAMLWSRFPRVVYHPPSGVRAFMSAAHRSGRLGALFVVTGLGWLVTSGLFARRARFVSFDNPGGEVRVSVTAIAEFLSRLAGEVPGLVALKPVVVARGAALYIDLQCRVRAGTRLPEMSRSLQDRVRDALSQSIGMTEIESITVSIRGIVGEPAAGPLPRALPADYGGAEPVIRGRGPRNDGEDLPPGPERRVR